MDGRRSKRLKSCQRPDGPRGVEELELENGLYSEAILANRDRLVNITSLIRTKPYGSKNRPVETSRIYFLAVARRTMTRPDFAPTLDVLLLS